ncbi:MFS transporter [Streptomyces sp. DSM 118878]
MASLAGGRLSDVLRRRKPFVLAAAVIYSMGLVLVAFSGEMTPFLVAMAVSGIGIGVYFAIGLALVADVLPDPRNAAKDLGVFNIASALPQSIACGECVEGWGCPVVGPACGGRRADPGGIQAGRAAASTASVIDSAYSSVSRSKSKSSAYHMGP